MKTIMHFIKFIVSYILSFKSNNIKHNNIILKSKKVLILTIKLKNNLSFLYENLFYNYFH
jgi:hypothetical protein